jgi:ACS family hexuronate transporter-like MFS transporter
MAQHSADIAITGTASKTIQHLRWYICGLLFLVTMINYIDRQTMGALNPILKNAKTGIGWDDGGYGWITFAFSLGYALMFGISGSLLDRFGVKVGMIWAVIVWSLAAIGHSFAGSVLGFVIARFCLGLGEAANFPGCIKAVAEWFPRRERALATGIFNSGTNVGVLFSPAIVWLAQTCGWQSAFIVTGSLGFLWLILWHIFYKAPEIHSNLGEKEREVILSDKDPAGGSARVPWTTLLRYRQVWAFLVGKLLTDAIWVFYLYWLPTYLVKERGVTPLLATMLTWYPYIAADFGSVGGGWLSGFLINRGWGVGRARLMAMAIFAFCMPGAIWAVLTNSLVVAISLISLATAAHQAWSANLFTIVSDMFPKKVVGSVVGLGGIGGALGGMFMNLLTGGILAHTHNYVPLFLIAGLMHPTALFLIMAFVGRDFKQADVDTGAGAAPSRNLTLAGTAVVGIGVALIGLVAANWNWLTTKSVHPAWQGLTGSVGISLLGLALLYASRGRPSSSVPSH